MMKGIYTFQLKDKEVGFKYGTLALGIAARKDGCSLSEFFKRIGLSTDEAEKKHMDTASLIHLFYGAAVNYLESIGKNTNITAAEVDEWANEIGYEKMMNMYVDALSQFVPKNSAAPEKLGQPVMMN